METDAGDILSVSDQGLYTRFVLVVPDLSHKVVSSRYEVGFVRAAIVVQTVDPFLVAHQCEVRLGGTHLPYLKPG